MGTIAAELIVEVLADAGGAGMTASELAAACHRHEGNVRRVLSQLLTSGVVAPHPLAGKGRVWALTGVAPRARLPRPPPRPPLPATRYGLPARLHRQLVELAAARGTSRAEISREAVARYLAEETSSREVAELA
jgi:hypothetical protein